MSACKILSIIENVVLSLEKKEAELNRLDANLGDGDHGRTIVNAFRNVLSQIKDVEFEDTGQALERVGRILAFSTGAAAGPLFGSAFIEAGKKIRGKENLDVEDWKEAMEGAVEGVKKRGKAEVGDKTMLDTIYPAFEALQESCQEKLPLKDALQKALDAAREGMHSTRDLVAKKGRSSRLGERTKGHIDPGAASSYYVLEAIIKSVLENK
ncbi:dihydroxyacetone kinase subunit L [Candidatus Aerophobetes bacterium]|nr:dihydroxyacetone kinase subunit L [Candidatus Aerophobetes bacterium]